jgi:hypothetical protein
MLCIGVSSWLFSFVGPTHRYAVPDLRWLGITAAMLQGVAQDTFQLLSNRDRLASLFARKQSQTTPLDSELCV